MTDLVSAKEMASILGISQTALNKAVKAGRVKVAAREGKNGRFKKYDPDQTVRLYNASTDPSKQRKTPVQQPARAKGAENRALADQASPAGTAPVSGSNSEVVAEQFQKARMMREAANAQLTKIKLDTAKNELVDKSVVEAALFDITRTLRDQLLALPSKLAVFVDEQDMEAVNEIIHDYITDLQSSLDKEVGEKASG